MMDQAFLGHKAPRPGRETLFWCPACVSPVEPGTPLTSRHVLEDCPSVEGTRMRLGITEFLESCLQAGRSRKTAYKFYVMGMDEHGARVDCGTHLRRGASLRKLTEDWLQIWEDPDNL